MSDSTVLTRERLAETNHGRSEGWDLELAGRVVAHLDEPQWEDMFWVSYRITPTTDDADLAVRLLSEGFWRGDDWTHLVFRSRILGLAADPFPSIEPLVAPARVNMRALYIMLPDDRPAPTKVPDAGDPLEAPRGSSGLGRLLRRLLSRPGAR